MSKYHKKLLYKLYLFIMVVVAIFAPIRGYLSKSETFVIYAENQNDSKQDVAQKLDEELAPRAEVTIPTPSSFKPTFNNEVEEYIYQVFGDTGYKRAMLLLKGNGPDTCAENRGLSPSAVNDNTAWGGVGRDWSIFQVNDVYHPVAELNLHTDWKANVDYAKRMYDNDGQTFGKRWTCGKVYAKEGLDI